MFYNRQINKIVTSCPAAQRGPWAVVGVSNNQLPNWCFKFNLSPSPKPPPLSSITIIPLPGFSFLNVIEHRFVSSSPCLANNCLSRIFEGNDIAVWHHGSSSRKNKCLRDRGGWGRGSKREQVEKRVCRLLHNFVVYSNTWNSGAVNVMSNVTWTHW